MLKAYDNLFYIFNTIPEFTELFILYRHHYDMYDLLPLKVTVRYLTLFRLINALRYKYNPKQLLDYRNFNFE